MFGLALFKRVIQWKKESKSRPWPTAQDVLNYIAQGVGADSDQVLHDLPRYLLSPHYPPELRNRILGILEWGGITEHFQLPAILREGIENVIENMRTGKINPARYFDRSLDVYRLLVESARRSNPTADMQMLDDPFTHHVYAAAFIIDMSELYNIRSVLEGFRLNGLRRMPTSWESDIAEVPQFIRFMNDHGVTSEKYDQWLNQARAHNERIYNYIHSAMVNRLNEIAKAAWSPFRETTIARISGETGLKYDEIIQWAETADWMGVSRTGNFHYLDGEPSRLDIRTEAGSPYERIHSAFEVVRRCIDHISSERTWKKYLTAALQEEFGITVYQLIEGLNLWEKRSERDEDYEESIMNMLMRADVAEYADDDENNGAMAFETMEPPEVVLKTKEAVLSEQLVRLRDLLYINAYRLAGDIGRLGREIYRLSTIRGKKLLDVEGDIYAFEVELRYKLGDRFNMNLEQVQNRLDLIDAIVENNREDLGSQYDAFREWVNDLRDKPWLDIDNRGMGGLQTGLRVILGDRVVDEGLGIRNGPGVERPPANDESHPLDPFLDLVKDYEDELGPLYSRWKMELEALKASGRPIQDKDFNRWEKMLSRKLGSDVVREIIGDKKGSGSGGSAPSSPVTPSDPTPPPSSLPPSFSSAPSLISNRGTQYLLGWICSDPHTFLRTPGNHLRF